MNNNADPTKCAAWGPLRSRILRSCAQIAVSSSSALDDAFSTEVL